MSKMEPEFFTIDEVANSLKVSSRTIRRWIDCGELAAHKLGASVRISRQDLAAFTALRRQPTRV